MEQNDITDILDQRRAGMTLQAIGNEFGVSRERIRQICLKHGVVPEKNWEGLPNSTEHRTVGSHRAWCYADAEWCYPGTLCLCCDQLGVPLAWRGDHAGWVLLELRRLVTGLKDQAIARNDDGQTEAFSAVLELIDGGPNGEPAPAPATIGTVPEVHPG
jgi:Sigma-70, region 4